MRRFQETESPCGQSLRATGTDESSADPARQTASKFVSTDEVLPGHTVGPYVADQTSSSNDNGAGTTSDR